MQIRKVDDGYFVCMNRGEKIIESFTRLAEEAQIQSATIIGIGAVFNTRLGFYHLHRKQYDEKLFPEEAELVSLKGNISWLNDKPSIHCHIVIGDTAFRAHAGHLFEAQIAVAGEFFVCTKKTRISRKFNEEIGLNLQDL